ncbi:hypothetical protein [Streptomyces sp. NPDC060198]|uniref:hypothetical protein n=1 Tax=Streptomyces sp. NPDC060198 TaxID=3347070 RepID=UPI00365C149E
MAADVLYAVGELFTQVRLPRLPGRRRRSEPSPERHPRETSEATATARRYEHMGRQDFEARVAAESGTRGWENLCILVVVLGVVGSAVLVHRAGYASHSVYLFAFSGVCSCWLPIRWYLHRR